MAIKTKEEMFGDGGGFGVMVPFSTVNAPGTGAGNRGIDFGEQLTSAIANRTHYALALNDEDLDARLIAFETNGLDAAYDGGLTATPGIGRVITKDGGAVEARSALTADYADDKSNATFRADATGDTHHQGGGFDFQGSVDPEAVVNGSGWAGYLDRRRLGIQPAGFGSFFSGDEAATLNPAGAGGDIVQLATGGRFFYTAVTVAPPALGNYTNLRLGFDMLEISGSANDNNLYIIFALGANANEVLVRSIDGSTPSFVVDESVTINVYRPKLASMGTSFTAARVALRGNVFMPDKGGGPAIRTMGSYDEGNGNQYESNYAKGDGTSASGTFIDRLGRLNFLVDADDYDEDFSNLVDQSRFGGGSWFSRAVRGGPNGAAQFTHIALEQSSNLAGRLDFVSLDKVDVPADGLGATTAFNFVANSPVAGEIQPSGMAGTWRDYLIGQFTLCEIQSPNTENGYYWVRSTATTPDRIFLDNLDGTNPGHFPTAGAGVAVFHYPSFVGNRPQASGFQNLVFGAASDVTPHNIFMSGLEDDSTALTVVSHPQSLGADRALVRGYTMNTGVGVNPEETFEIKPDGTFRTRGNYSYELNRVRDVMVPFYSAMLADGNSWTSGGANKETSRYLEATGVNAVATMDINDLLPEGAVVNDIQVRVNLASAGGAFRVRMRYASRSMVTTAEPILTTVGTETATAASGWQTISLAASIGGSGHTVNKAVFASSGRDYFLEIKSEAIGDEVHAIRIEYDDPGPRSL